MEKNIGTIEGRNPVLEAFRAGNAVDKLYVLKGCFDGPVQSIVREAKKQGTLIDFVAELSLRGRQGQGVQGQKGLGDVPFPPPIPGSVSASLLLQTSFLCSPGRGAGQGCPGYQVHAQHVDT